MKKKTKMNNNIMRKIHINIFSPINKNGKE
uniref:Uncharacterized protein n=1 Tax=viral metagenome TaxID=1070528 RepID=A0A6C0B6U4_9ZZZZ